MVILKLTRSAKCHFGQFITQKKQQELNRVMKEYSRVVNLFIGKYQKEIPRMRRFDLLTKGYIHSVDTWFSARIIKDAFAEGYGMVQSAKSNAKGRKQRYIRPRHHGKKMILSETIVTIHQNPHTRLFDLITILGCIGNRLKIPILLKKHKHFNQYQEWRMSKSVVVTHKYVQFTFSKHITKKNEGKAIGMDFGINKFIATSDRETIGEGYKELLQKLLRKKQGSKAWYRCKEEIREFIDYHIRNLPFEQYGMVVIERLNNVHHRMRLKRRLSKRMRRLVSKWTFRYSYGRLMANCDLNCVRYRTVSAYQNSITCPACGHADQRNRMTQEDFCCQSCGYSDNSDFTSAKVSLQKYIRSIPGPYGARLQADKLFIFI